MLNFIVSEMNFKFKHILLLLLAIGLYASCVKKKSYSQNPEIEFKSFVPYAGDTADLTIAFSDGNGDIGKAQEDQTKNMFMTYYYFDTLTSKYTAFYKPELLDTLRMDYTIRKPNDSYNGKPISGEVMVRINEYRHSKKIKKIKYVIYIVDNANNKSNVLTTTEIIVP